MTTGTPNAGQLRVTFDAYYNHTYVRDLNGSGFGLYLAGNQSTLSNSDFIGLVPVGQTLTGTSGMVVTCLIQTCGVAA